MTNKNEIKLNWNIIERFVEDIAIKSYQNTAKINKNEYLDLFKFVWFCCGFNFFLPGKQEDYNGYYILYLIEKFPLALYKIFFENQNENNADIVTSILEIINKTDDFIDSNKNQETHSQSDNETPEKRIQFVLNKMLWFSKENTEYLLNKINGIRKNQLLMKEQMVFLDGEYNKKNIGGLRILCLKNEFPKFFCKYYNLIDSHFFNNIKDTFWLTLTRKALGSSLSLLHFM